MSSLAEGERRLLGEVARRALTLAVTSGAALEDLPQNEILRQPCGAFVTLRLRRRLRGCMGQLPSGEALIDVVAHCARSAALDDPRFPPVPANELPEITIEISVLSALSEIAPSQIVAGKHGLLVTNGTRRGVLLPQVATQFGWTGMRLLEETCIKAGLPRETWKDSGTRIEAFTAESFAELPEGIATPGESLRE